MRYFLGALVAMFMAQSSRADIIFTLAPATQEIVQGTTGVFDVFIRTNTVNPELVNSIEMNILAGAGNGSGGVFLPSSTTFFLGSTLFDVTVNSGQAFTVNFQPPGINVPTTDLLYARLNLNTTGVTPGTRTISFQLTNSTGDSRLNANSPLTGRLATVGVNANYTIVAVPEPGTLALIGLGLLGAVVSRRRYRVLGCR